MTHIADNQDALLDYLYGEGDPAERVTIARHLQECAPCSVAVLEFQTVRGMLSEWAPPASQLGFRIVPGGDADMRPGDQPNPAVRPGWWTGRGPAATGRRSMWMQAAAGIVLFAAGMAVSQVDVEYRDGALTVRSRSAGPAVARQNAAVDPPSVPNQTTAAPAGRPDVPTAPYSPVAAASSDTAGIANLEDVKREMRAMINESERRQQRELALRLSQVAREVDTQRRADVHSIQQNLGQIEMETGAQIEQQQRQMMELLVRTSGGAK